MSPIPTFSPPVGASYEYTETTQPAVEATGFQAGYTQVHPVSIRMPRTASLVFDRLSNTQRGEIEAFFAELEGKPGPFYWSSYDETPSLLAAPTLASVAGGSLGAATYYVQATWYDATHGETLPSAEGSLAVASSHFLRVTVPPMPNGVGSWRVYVSTSTGTEVLEDTITGSRTWTQSAALSGSGSPPTTNTLNAVGKWELAGAIEKTRFAAGVWRMKLQLRELFL